VSAFSQNDGAMRRKWMAKEPPTDKGSGIVDAVAKLVLGTTRPRRKGSRRLLGGGMIKERPGMGRP